MPSLPHTLLFLFCYIFLKNVKTLSKLENRLEFADPYIVEKEMMGDCYND